MSTPSIIVIVVILIALIAVFLVRHKSNKRQEESRFQTQESRLSSQEISDDTPHDMDDRHKSLYQLEYNVIPFLVDKVGESKESGIFSLKMLTSKNELKKLCTDKAHIEWSQLNIQMTHLPGGSNKPCILYEFPTPLQTPEAKFGAVIMTPKGACYYTLEKSFADRWFFCNPTSAQHNNLGQFVEPPLADFFLRRVAKFC